MEDGGYFIIGDEFLPPQEVSDSDAYLDALETEQVVIVGALGTAIIIRPPWFTI
jgi:hypothetical protein